MLDSNSGSSCDLMAPGLTMQTHRRTTQSHITGRKVKIHYTRHNISSLGEFPHPQKHAWIKPWLMGVGVYGGKDFWKRYVLA